MNQNNGWMFKRGGSARGMAMVLLLAAMVMASGCTNTVPGTNETNGGGGFMSPSIHVGLGMEGIPSLGNEVNLTVMLKGYPLTNLSNSFIGVVLSDGFELVSGNLTKIEGELSDYDWLNKTVIIKAIRTGAWEIGFSICENPRMEGEIMHCDGFGVNSLFVNVTETTGTVSHRSFNQEIPNQTVSPVAWRTL